MNNQVMVIMQGEPGSGKSTFAKRIMCVFDATIHCTDDMRYINGVYVFKNEESADLHRQNQAQARITLQYGKSVIIDNTNIKRWEARPYVEMAVELGVWIVFIRCTGRYPNIHGVPLDKVDQMRLQLEDLTIESCLASQYPWENK